MLCMVIASVPLHFPLIHPCCGRFVDKVYNIVFPPLTCLLCYSVFLIISLEPPQSDAFCSEMQIEMERFYSSAPTHHSPLTRMLIKIKWFRLMRFTGANAIHPSTWSRPTTTIQNPADINKINSSRFILGPDNNKNNHHHQCEIQISMRLFVR